MYIKIRMKKKSKEKWKFDMMVLVYSEIKRPEYGDIKRTGDLCMMYGQLIYGLDVCPLQLPGPGFYFPVFSPLPCNGLV